MMAAGLVKIFSTTQYSYIDGSVGMSYNSNIGNNENNNFFLVRLTITSTGQKYFYRNASIEVHPKWVFRAGCGWSY